jgi:hypothetical protein
MIINVTILTAARMGCAVSRECATTCGEAGQLREEQQLQSASLAFAVDVER